jgi:hypothetical protein
MLPAVNMQRKSGAGVLARVPVLRLGPAVPDCPHKYGLPDYFDMPGRHIRLIQQNEKLKSLPNRLPGILIPDGKNTLTSRDSTAFLPVETVQRISPG